MGELPFLRWIGGKIRLVHLLSELVPVPCLHSCYFEPFLGAGSLFFMLAPSRAVLGDKNQELIDCFTRVRSSPELVWRHLRPLIKQKGQRAYYEARAKFNQSNDSYAKAALFIYLNKACFNGVWRVNKKGEFNVPYGLKNKPGFPSLTKLKAAAKALLCADLRSTDFEATLAGARKDDFVYLDPPYPPLNGTSYFTHYTVGRFDLREQERLARVFAELDSRGCKVLLSNADLPVIRRLYGGYRVKRIAVHRWVASSGVRYKVAELAIMNY